MALKYLHQGMPTAKPEVIRPKTAPEQDTTRIKNRKPLFCLLLVVNIIVLNAVHGIWAAEKDTPLWEAVLTDSIIYRLWPKGGSSVISGTSINKNGVVTGILFNSENPRALVNNQVIHEGDVLGGVTVVKISRNKVEFEKNGKTWAQSVRQKPNSTW